MSTSKKILVGLGAFFGLGLVGQLAGVQQNAPKSEAPQTQEQRQERQRDNQAYLAAKALKASLRNPDSLKFETILSNVDGTVVCVSYRAENGFGGMNLGHVVFKNGRATESLTTWRKNCAHKLLYDLTSVGMMI